MILEVRSSFIVDTDKIVSLHIETKSGVCGNYNIYIVSTLDGKDFHIKEDDYNKLKNILIHGIVNRKLSIFQKMKISFVCWLKGLRMKKSSSQD